MIKVTIDQAASRFAHWIALIGKGEEVVVLDHEQPVARITRCEPTSGTRPNDPFDRLIIAQALEQGLSIISPDAFFPGLRRAGDLVNHIHNQPA
jgi:antitoxin (DNA-binding transcriptional repressor) of toxin-antitoxin stability system